MYRRFPLLICVTFISFFSVSVVLLGTRGCGKSLAFSKVVRHLPHGTTVKYLILGESTNFSYEVDQLKKLRPYSTNIVVIENFNPKNNHHIHFAISLMSGRILYDERKEKFNKLPNLTVFIELDCEMEDLPQHMIFNMAVLRMIKGSIHKPRGLFRGFSQMTTLLHEPYLVKVSTKGAGG